MAKVTGTQLKNMIKVCNAELDVVRSNWDGSLHRFVDEVKPNPLELATRIEDLEERVALLQTAQGYLNLNVKVDYFGKTITLMQAIKLVGGKGRVAKLWREASKGEKTDRWGRRDVLERDSTKEFASPTINKEEAFAQFRSAESRASKLRELISWGNAQVVEIPWLDDNQ
jgi:hypothetical protein